MATTLTVHHTTAKKASENGLVVTIDADTNQAIVTMAGVVLHRGDAGQAAKDVLDHALDIIDDNGGDDFDIEAYRAEQGDDDGDEATDGGSIVKAKYRERYRAFGGDNCGDAFAEAWKDATHVPDLNKAGEQRVKKNGAVKTRVDEALAQGVLEANGLSFRSLGGRNTGHSIMIGMNILRGMPNKGKTVRIGDTTFEPTDEWKAEQKAKAEAKAAREQAQAEARAKREADAKARDEAKAKRAAEAEAKAAQAQAEPKAQEAAKPAKPRKPSKAERQAALGKATAGGR